MTKMERKDALGKGDKAQEEKWGVHSMRSQDLAGMAGVSGASLTSGQWQGLGTERMPGAWSKKHQEGFRFVWKRIFLQGM